MVYTIPQASMKTGIPIPTLRSRMKSLKDHAWRKLGRDYYLNDDELKLLLVTPKRGRKYGGKAAVGREPERVAVTETA